MLIISHDDFKTVIVEYQDDGILEEFTLVKTKKYKDESGEEQEMEFEIKCMVVSSVLMVAKENKTVTKAQIEGMIGKCKDGSDIMEKIYKGGRVPVKNIIVPQQKNPVNRKIILGN